MQLNGESLEGYRERIDNIDQAILDCIAQRIEVCKKIGHYKKNRGITMMQPERVKIVMKNVRKLAGLYGLCPKFVKELYSLIQAEIFKIENQIINDVNTLQK